ncbi:MAG: DNA methyltransferase [Myxococcales bacterium]|nr:DNA methyltransferase [Myxococcota bacterium]MDW8282906.1 DNA methyltransferase [Myxococcales bacterium]
MFRPSPVGAPPVERRRRALSAPAGRTVLRGEPASAERLRQALTVPPWPASIPEAERELVERALSMHLFHGFAGRSHPLLVRHLLEGVGPGKVVLDPFVGSGTVLIEAALRGAQALGQDVGELQVRLSRFRATPMPRSMRAALMSRAQEVAAASLERVRKRIRPARCWDEPRHYEPHVYLELCGLRDEIGRVVLQDAPLGEALLLIFSSLVIKASRQEAQTSLRTVRRAIPRGQVSRWFLRRAEELDRLLSAFSERVPRGTPRPQVQLGDSRAVMPDVPKGSVDVLLTSPPYLGVYDYVAHHIRRCAWLDIDAGPLWRNEIGARRRGGDAATRLAEHARDTAAWLECAATLLRPGGLAYILVGDAALPGGPFPGDRPVLAAAPAVGLGLVAACSVERGPRRWEHLLLFQKS